MENIKQNMENALFHLKKLGWERGQIEEHLGYSEEYIDQSLSKGGSKKLLKLLENLLENATLQKNVSSDSLKSSVVEPLQKDYQAERLSKKNGDKPDIPVFTGNTRAGTIEIYTDDPSQQTPIGHLSAKVFPGCNHAEKEFVDGKFLNNNIGNRAISQEISKREKKLSELLASGVELSIENIRKDRSKNFFTAAIAHYEGLRIRTKEGYADRCITAIKDFKEFSGEQTFQSITNELLKNYETHLLKKKLARNTINRKFKRLKQVFIAHGEKWTYKPLTYKQPSRDFLTMEEIKEIEGVSFEHPVRYYFLLSCYTGLRYSDLSQVKERIVTNNGVQKIILSTTKTGSQVSIKLTPKIIDLIEKINEPLICNVQANRVLKEIVSFTEIKRKITFHLARHSFAVNSASLGMPIEVVSRLLGHSSIRTTSIYYKITDVNLDNWMEKWS